MESVWKQILEFWKKYPAVSMSTLGRPASLDEVQTAELILGCTFPRDFVTFYQIHNGWPELVMPSASKLLDLHGICEHAPLVAKRTPDEFSILTPFIVSSRNRDFYCLNLSPNRFGSVVFVSTDVPEAYEVADSFSAWIKRYADDPASMRQ